MTPKSEFLLKAMRDRTLIQFERRFETSSVHGYVLAIGPKFLLLALVSDRLWFDGFECFRISDIRQPQPDPHVRFAEAALAARGEVCPSCAVSVDSLASLLTSAASFPLMTIHTEALYPEECYIGRLVAVSQGTLSLLEIDADAKWDADPTVYRLSDITRVNFDGDYERALALVGGEP